MPSVHLPDGRGGVLPSTPSTLDVPSAYPCLPRIVIRWRRRSSRPYLALYLSENLIPTQEEKSEPITIYADSAELPGVFGLSWWIAMDLHAGFLRHSADKR